MDAKKLRDLADNVFGKRATLLSLWQEIAENFYPQRADFTLKRYLGDDFAENLMTSYPLLMARELTGNIGTMLRPTAKEWFEMTVAHTNKLDHEAKAWLEWATGVQRRAMYDIKSLFTKAAAESDADYSSFGQYVMSGRLNRMRDRLLYRCWHLRDVAWVEDEEGNACPVFRKWRPTLQTLVRLFKEQQLHRSILDRAKKEPFAEIEVYHMIVPADLYDDGARGRPYWSIYYDCTHNELIEALPVWNKEYVIARWQTVSGSQYAYSPATVAALPEARLIQAMTYTLLEAGEKVTNPPMVATEGAVKSDVSLYAGGISWVDYEYDERLGEALRPMTINAQGMPIGIDMQRDTRAVLKEAFFLNKLNMPVRGPEMTAYEVAQRVQQYIRDALPIFEPMEAECNGQICELTFDVLLRGGGFGSPFDMPRSLRDHDIQFKFKTPLHDAIEEQKGHKFLEMKQLLAEAVALDKNAAAVPNVVVALRDALEGIKTPAKWMRSKVEAAQMAAAEDERQSAAQLLGTMQQGADVAETVGRTAKDLKLAEAA